MLQWLTCKHRFMCVPTSVPHPSHNSLYVSASAFQSACCFLPISCLFMSLSSFFIMLSCSLLSYSQVPISSTLVFTPNTNEGGKPYSVFSYTTVDQYGTRADSRVTVSVNVACPAGSRVVQSRALCVPCVPGTFLANASYNTECTL